MIEYLMLAGVNDSADDARELAAWLSGLDVHVNLIPYNPIESAPHLRTTERPERDAFAAILRDGRLRHDDSLLARRRHRRRLRPARATRESADRPAAGATSHASRVNAYGAMDDIIAGVRTFQRDVYPQYRELFEKLAAGQSPEALVITCSDSRVDPFLFTQAQPGQLFVLRNAGNLVPKYDGLVGGVTATIEFAVVGAAACRTSSSAATPAAARCTGCCIPNSCRTCRTWPTG